MKRRTGQKALLFYIEKYDGPDHWIKRSSRPLKHALTYMNKFTIDEDDQYDIASIQKLKFDDEPLILTSGVDSRYGLKYRRLTKIERMMRSMSSLSASHIDIFYFGWCDSRENWGYTKPDINGFLQKCFLYINSKIENVRISFMDLNIRYLRDSAVPFRTDVQGVKNLYNKQGTYTVSLNDQMELFYEKCKDDELTQHEVAYYFHAELLPLQLEEKFRDKKNKFIFKESKENKFYLYAGVRGTLIFHPQPAVLGQRTRKFSNLANRSCEKF